MAKKNNTNIFNTNHNLEIEESCTNDKQEDSRVTPPGIKLQELFCNSNHSRSHLRDLKKHTFHT